MQQVVICALYYLCEVDCIVLIDLGSIVNEQTLTTENSKKKATQLLDYLGTKTNAKIAVYVSCMILNIYLDSS